MHTRAILPSTLTLSTLIKVLMLALLMCGTYFVGGAYWLLQRNAHENKSLIELTDAFLGAHADSTGTASIGYLRQTALERFSLVSKQTGKIGMLAPEDLDGGISDPVAASAIEAFLTNGSTSPVWRLKTEGARIIVLSVVRIATGGRACTGCSMGTSTSGELGGLLLIESDMTADFAALAIQALVVLLLSAGGISFVYHRDAMQQREIAAERASLRELERIVEGEQQRLQMQRKFVSIVSHEFRTPLTIIQGTVDSLVRRIERYDKAQILNKAQTVTISVSRMINLLESFLYSSKHDEGGIEFRPEWFDLPELLEETCRQQEHITPSHKIERDFGDAGAYFGDEQMVHHIFTNLLSNAVKYSPGAELVKVRVFTDGRWLIIEVSDFGLGIPEDEMGKMFTRFFRARTATGITGTGIGLELCLSLAKQHHGRIEVKSTEGEGSTFRLVLPTVETLQAEVPGYVDIVADTSDAAA